MKVTVTVVMVLVLALIVGVAYAESSMSRAEVPYNGVTYFDLGPATDCASVRGAGAGAVIPAAEHELMNGATHFELAIPGSRDLGLCAGSISEEKIGARLNNGITVFE
jgi:hypothetical protein